MQRTAEDLLKTYLGERTGECVLAGRTTRGEGEKIYAVILLCDLRDSTRLSQSLAVEDFFRSLNEFFYCTAAAVLEHGGEVLSYIGDAVFAIFAIGGTDKLLRDSCFPEEGACAAALAAAQDTQTRVDALNQRRERRGKSRLRFGLALHVGEVMYGNLGVPRRMQFTVVGAPPARPRAWLPCARIWGTGFWFPRLSRPAFQTRWYHLATTQCAVLKRPKRSLR
jgi:adenylate cyclase